MFYRLGQTCNHVAGLLYRVEAANKLGVTACTSGTCMWLQPSDKKLQPAQLKQMDFKKSRHGKTGMINYHIHVIVYL